MDFVTGVFAQWLLERLADAGRSRLTRFLLGDEQERALRAAANTAIRLTAEDFYPGGGPRAEQMAMVIDRVFGDSVPVEPMAGHATLLQALQAGMAARVAPLGDADLTGTGWSSAELLGVSAAALDEKLIGHLVREIVSRGARGGPLEPLAGQLNHDVTHLQGQRVEGKLDQLARSVEEALAGFGRILSKLDLLKKEGLPDRRLFVGRATDLERLGSIGSRGVVTDLLVGLGGIGKTAMVLEYAHRSLDSTNPPHFVWWFDASTRAGLASKMGALYRELTGVIADDLTAAERLRSWLESYSGRWLVVFDNADGRETLQQLVPSVGSGQVLVTSRRQFWDHMEVLLIKELAPDDAVALLERKSGLVDPAGAAMLAEELGNLALSLVQAASYLARKARSGPGWSYDRYRHLLRTMPHVVHERDAAEVDKTMAKVIRTSLEAVGQNARDILGIIAYLAPNDIPADLFTQPVIRDQPLLGSGNEMDVSDALEALVGYSLLTFDQASGSATYGVHRVVQAVVRASLAGTAEHASAAVRLVTAVHPKNSVGRPRPSPQWVSHVRALDANLRELQRRGGAVDEDVTIRLAELMYAVARALRDQVSDYRAAASVAARAAKLFKVSLGDTNIAYAKALNYLAAILSHLECFWLARSFDEEAVRIERAIPASDLDLSWAVHDLAIDFRDLADRGDATERLQLLHQARDYLDEAMELNRGVPNLRTRIADVAWFLQDSASLYDRDGDRYRAISELEEALALVDQHLPEHDPRRGRPRVNLAAQLCPTPSDRSIATGYQGDPVRGEQLAREALAIWEMSYGFDHALVARALLRIAQCIIAQQSSDQSRKREAREYLQRALEITRRRFPVTHTLRKDIEKTLLSL
jgi:tetratricopeptide (TPR) repeat protein